MDPSSHWTGPPISGAPTFYTDANKLGNAGYKSGNLKWLKSLMILFKSHNSMLF